MGRSGAGESRAQGSCGYHPAHYPTRPHAAYLAAPEHPSPQHENPPLAQSYLDGAVTVERLGATSADGRFRVADERGEVAWPAIGEPTEYVHVIDFASPGVRRGFHRHTRHRERLYLFRGALRALARAGDGPVAELHLAAGDLVTFAPDVAHGFIALEPSLAVALGTGSNPLHDTLPAPDLG